MTHLVLMPVHLHHFEPISDCMCAFIRDGLIIRANMFLLFLARLPKHSLKIIVQNSGFIFQIHDLNLNSNS